MGNKTHDMRYHWAGFTDSSIINPESDDQSLMLMLPWYNWSSFPLPPAGEEWVRSHLSPFPTLELADVAASWRNWAVMKPNEPRALCLHWKQWKVWRGHLLTVWKHPHIIGMRKIKGHRKMETRCACTRVHIDGYGSNSYVTSVTSFCTECVAICG